MRLCIPEDLHTRQLVLTSTAALTAAPAIQGHTTAWCALRMCPISPCLVQQGHMSGGALLLCACHLMRLLKDLHTSQLVLPSPTQLALLDVSCP